MLKFPAALYQACQLPEKERQELVILDLRSEEEKDPNYKKPEEPSPNTIRREINIWEESPTLVASREVSQYDSWWNPSVHNLESFE